MNAGCFIQPAMSFVTGSSSVNLLCSRRQFLQGQSIFNAVINKTAECFIAFLGKVDTVSADPFRVLCRFGKQIKEQCTLLFCGFLHRIMNKPFKNRTGDGSPSYLRILSIIDFEIPVSLLS